MASKKNSGKSIKKTTSNKKTPKSSKTNKLEKGKDSLLKPPTMIYKLTEQGSRSIVGMEVYRTDEENYEPYVSPYNQADNSSSDDESKSNGSESTEEETDEDTDDKSTSKKKKKTDNKTNNVTIKNNEEKPSTDTTSTTSEPRNIIMSIDLNETSSDKKTLNTIANILEKAGHKVEQLGVGPNVLQSAMKKSSNKGKTAIYLVNGADVGTYKDIAVGIKNNAYYNAKYCYFGLQGWISPSTCSCKGAKTVKLSKAHDDNYSSNSFTANVVGKTTAEVCEMYKKQIGYACGDSAEELGNHLVEVMGGATSSDEKKEENGSTIKEALQKLLTHWDGEVECFVRGDTVHVNKVRNPETFHSSVLQEGVNVFRDSLSVTDINPNTVNTLIVNWTGGTITLTDDKLIERFGEVTKEMTAVKKVIQEVPVSDESESDSEDEEETTDDTETEDA